MKKLCTYQIEYCNSLCVHFYHKYDDGENAWCGRLDKMIFPYEDSDFPYIFDDHKEREFPKECPLQDS